MKIFFLSWIVLTVSFFATLHADAVNKEMSFYTGTFDIIDN